MDWLEWDTRLVITCTEGQEQSRNGQLKIRLSATNVSTVSDVYR